VILQTLDIKDNCTGIFHQGTFKLEEYENLIKDFSLAWKHSPILDDEQFCYLYLYLKQDDLSTFSHDTELFVTYKDKLLAHKKAAMAARIDMAHVCFFDLLPRHQLHRWFSMRESALNNLATSLDKSDDYDILHKAHVLTTNISHQDVTFGDRTGRIVYNIFGSATGRLTTKRNSIPILTLKKEQRALLRPQNDAFVELDLNAAEIRMLMALSGDTQPQGDIHEWVVENVFQNGIDRSQAKIELFAWLYNPSNSKSRFDKIFSRQIFRDFYLSEDKLLTTPFGRKLVVEERKAQNYLLQSTTSDQVLENAYKIQKMLTGKKTKIAFTLHDSIILDMSQEDVIMLRDIKEQFEKTRWGNFVSTCKVGKSFANLKELEI
tara:strand:+ start:9998 stop:11128 length:1131 start_codon:yes stop_codon:yes gene_type:complete